MSAAYQPDFFGHSQPEKGTIPDKTEVIHLPSGRQGYVVTSHRHGREPQSYYVRFGHSNGDFIRCFHDDLRRVR